MKRRLSRLLTEQRLLVVSQIVGQLALVLITPVLTRLVVPSQMGVYQIALAVAVIGIPIATLRTEYLIPLAHDGRELAGFARTALIACVVTTVVVAGIMFAAEPGGAWTRTEIAVSTALILVSYAATTVGNARAIRFDAMGLLTRRNFWSGIIGAVAQIVLCLVWPSALSLAAGQALGRIAAQLVFRVPRDAALVPTDDAALHPPRTLARTISGVASGAIGSASSQGLVLIAGASYGSAAAGQVGLAQRIVGAPTSLAGQGLSQMVTGTTSRVLRSGGGSLMNALRPTIVKLLGLSLAIAVVVMAAGPTLAPIVLGASWRSAGQLMAVLAVPLALQIALVPLASVFMMLGRERLLFWLQTCRLAVIAAAVFVGFALGWAFLVTAIVVSAAWTAAYLFYLGAALWSIRYRDAHAASTPSSRGLQ